MDATTHKALNSALTDARADLQQAMVTDHLAVADAVSAGKPLPADKMLQASQRFERLRLALQHHAEVVSARHLSGYHDALVTVLTCRADVIGEAGRLRQQTLAKLAEPMLAFEQAQSVQIADKSTMITELMSFSQSLRTAATRIKAGDRLIPGTIPDDCNYQRYLAGLSSIS